MQKPHDNRAHAEISASGASRWINCTPSTSLEKQMPKEQSSAFAAEGTLAHELSDLELSKAVGLIDATKYKKARGLIEANKLYTVDMPGHTAVYVDYVLESYAAALAMDPKAILLIEKRVDLGAWIKNGFGTCDAIIIGSRTLEVIDLKYGKGVAVSALKNMQLMLYALGALDLYDMLYDVEKVILTIAQPRNGGIDSWSTTAKELYDWADNVVLPSAKAALAGEGEAAVGDWCKFCKAKPICKAYADKQLKLLEHKFAEPQTLTDLELVDVRSQMQALSSWLKETDAYMYRKALYDGHKWPGLKLVDGRSVRKIVDQEGALEALAHEGFEEQDYVEYKIKGITELEKLVGKKVFPQLLGPFIAKSTPSPSLVPFDDKRPEISYVMTPEEAFKDCEDEA